MRFLEGGGSGFLNNVDGTIVSVRFTDQRPVAKSPKPGQTVAPPANTSDFRWLYAKLSVQVDHEELLQETHLTVGDAKDWHISIDGTLIVPVDERVGIRKGTDLYKFVTSLLEASYPPADLPTAEPGESINLEQHLRGKRFRFAQILDLAKTKKLGPRIDPKTGRSYDRTYLGVAKYYPAATPTIVGGNGATVAANQTVPAMVDAILADVVRANQNKPIKVGDLKLKLTIACGQGTPYHAYRPDILNWSADPTNFQYLTKVSYEPTTQMLGEKIPF